MTSPRKPMSLGAALGGLSPTPQADQAPPAKGSRRERAAKADQVLARAAREVLDTDTDTDPTPREADRPAPSGVVVQIPLEDLEVGTNVRTDLGDLEELAESIREHGVLQPIRVRRRRGGVGYTVVWGQRRTKAAELAGLERIPAIVVQGEYSKVDLAIEQLVENLQRSDLSAIEAARALRICLDADTELSHAALAGKLGMSKAWVTNTVALLGLVDEVQQALVDGIITGGHAKALLGLPAKQQRELLKNVTDFTWSCRQVEAEAARFRREQELVARIVERCRAELDTIRANEGTVEKLFVSADGLVTRALREADYPVTPGQQGSDFWYIPDGTLPCCSTSWLLWAWNESAKVQRVCSNPEHAKARRNAMGDSDAARREQWAREAEERKRHREELHARAAPVVVEQLRARAPTADRLLLRLLAENDYELQRELEERYAPQEPAEGEEEDEADYHVIVLNRIPERKVGEEIAAALTRFVVTQEDEDVLELLGLQS